MKRRDSNWRTVPWGSAPGGVGNAPRCARTSWHANVWVGRCGHFVGVGPGVEPGVQAGVVEWSVG